LTTVSQVDPIYASSRSASSGRSAVFRAGRAAPRAADIELELILADAVRYPTRGRAVAVDRQVDVTPAPSGARRVRESRQRAASRPVRQGASAVRRDEEERTSPCPSEPCKRQGTYHRGRPAHDIPWNVRAVKLDGRVD
jgi:hypothetical protein